MAKGIILYNNLKNIGGIFVVEKKKMVVGSLLLLFLGSIIYVTLIDEGLKIRIDNDKSRFYVLSEGRWRISGTEYNKLMDGASNMNRVSNSIRVWNVTDESKNQTTIYRSTRYIRGPLVIDKYFFDGTLTDVEMFPVNHTVQLYNASGYYYKYEVKDLDYTGDSFKLDGLQTSQSFGLNMKVSWWNDYRLGWVYANGNMYVKSVKITDDYVEFEVRLFDPVESDNRINADNVLMYLPGNESKDFSNYGHTVTNIGSVTAGTDSYAGLKAYSFTGSQSLQYPGIGTAAPTDALGPLHINSTSAAVASPTH